MEFEKEMSSDGIYSWRLTDNKNIANVFNDYFSNIEIKMAQHIKNPDKSYH